MTRPSTARKDSGLRLVAYLRVSTVEQAENGLGLDIQREAIERWAKHNGHQVVLWTRDEGVSGSNGIDERDGLLLALAALADGNAEGLVAYNLDRLARKLTVQEVVLGKVWDQGQLVFTVEDGEVPQDDPDDPYRTAMRQVRGVFAQLERAVIAKRMRDGRRKKAQRDGFIGGHAPLGWRLRDGRLVRVKAEQRVLRRMRELRAQDPPATYRAVAAALTAEGLPTKKGGAWAPETVRTALLAAARAERIERAQQAESRATKT